MVGQSEINNIFSSVAGRYNLMNDIVSFGLHRLWKRDLCNNVAGSSGGSLLDVAGGTGDIAMRAMRANPGLKTTVCDINPDMLNVGRQIATDAGFVTIEWVCGSAECLPFVRNSFDYYTIAFGIRNVPDRAAALREAYRVLKKTGSFLCIEFSPIKSKGVFKLAYDLYSSLVIPKIGKLVAGNSEAYSYLVNSIRAFPSQEELASEISGAGFTKVTYHNVCMGIATIYSALKA